MKDRSARGRSPVGGSCGRWLRSGLHPAYAAGDGVARWDPRRVLGFGIALFITEVIIGNPPDQTGFDWALWTDVLLTIVGVVLGIGAARRVAGRRRSSAA